MHFHFFLPMNLHYIVLFCFACLFVFNRIKAAGMWHKCSNLGGVPASRVGSVSRTQTWNRFSTSVNELLDNSLFLWSSLGKTECIFGMCSPLDTWDRLSFDPGGKKDWPVPPIPMDMDNQLYFLMVLWGGKQLLSFSHTLAMTAEWFHLWVRVFFTDISTDFIGEQKQGKVGENSILLFSNKLIKTFNNFNP